MKADFQACEKNSIEKMVMFFRLAHYDIDTMEELEEKPSEEDEDKGRNLPATVSS